MKQNTEHKKENHEAVITDAIYGHIESWENQLKTMEEKARQMNSEVRFKVHSATRDLHKRVQQEKTRLQALIAKGETASEILKDGFSDSLKSLDESIQKTKDMFFSNQQK